MVQKGTNAEIETCKGSIERRYDPSGVDDLQRARVDGRVLVAARAIHRGAGGRARVTGGRFNKLVMGWKKL